ncbi:MAG: glycosyltransferase family 2 protein [Stenotrophobium sp.]
MDMANKQLISIVVPAYNEELNVERTFAAIALETDALADRYRFEFVFIDDHSTDSTFTKLQALATADKRLCVYRFQRNYGVQRAVHTGFVLARGDAAILLDCDLQDPPALIPQFLTQWEMGYKVVYGVRRTRKEGWLINTTRRAFYWLIDKLSPDELPRDAGDCRLIDRCVIRELAKIEDTSIYVRGRIASMGYPHVGVPYDRDAREFGKSSFTLLSLMGVALDGITSHSVIPLRLATLLGFLLVLAAFAGIVFFAVGRFAFGANWPVGFATLVVVLLFSTGLNGLFLGIIGEYLGRIYTQIKVKSDPLFEAGLVDGVVRPPDAISDALVSATPNRPRASTHE